MSDSREVLLDIVRAYWPIPLCSFLVSLVSTALCRRFALRHDIVDRPDDFLKPHKQPIPYLGGVAVYLGWAAGIVLALIMFDRVTEIPDMPRPGPSMHVVMMIGILVAVTVIMLLGLYDDLRTVSPKVKLGVQIALAGWLMAIGVGDDTIVVLLQVKLEFGPWLLLAYSIPLTLLITVGASNATNLIDGMDGLCSGVLGIISVGFLVIAVHLHLWSDWHPWDVQRVVLSLALLGASFGFLPFNRSPAKIFMGDAGSMVLGLNAAILLLLFAKSGGGALRWFWGAAMVFGLPLADMALTLVRRWRSERPVMEGDRSHYYDQLVDRGLPVRRVVRISYMLAACFAGLGCLVIWLRTRYIVIVYFLAVMAVVVVVKRLRLVRAERAPNAGHEPPRSAGGKS